jgi:hypothetical protein
LRLKITRSKGSTKLGASLPEDGNVVFFKEKFWTMDRVQKKKKKEDCVSGQDDGVRSCGNCWALKSVFTQYTSCSLLAVLYIVYDM